ncbi:MAG: hypothetical protein LQ339_008181 [Xanthoria mediterranea]|nr:MAG: hypothetical protein LQ339_008181 [Xanthoria mediterranea]
MAPLYGTNSSYSSSSSSVTSLSEPTSPALSSKFDRGVSRNANPASRRDVVSAPAAFQPPRSSPGSDSADKRTSSSGSLFSTSSNNELLMMKSTKAAKKKRSSLSAHNVYATKGPDGRTRVGSGSGAPTACSLM